MQRTDIGSKGVNKTSANQGTLAVYSIILLPRNDLLTVKVLKNKTRSRGALAVKVLIKQVQKGHLSSVHIKLLRRSDL